MTSLAVLGDFGHAISWIFKAREAGTGGVSVGGSNNWPLLGRHLVVSGASIGFALLIALPIGLWLGHIGRFSFIAISVSNVGRAVPSLAIIAALVAFFSFGPYTTVITALTLLAIPPVLTNAYVGVRQVPRDTVDAARGMGLTGFQIVRQIELPMALPLICGGVRTAAVNVVATATIAPLAGVVTLGDPIINGAIVGIEGQLGAALIVAFLAVIVELGLGALQKLVTPTGLKFEGGAAPRARRFPRRRVQTIP